MFSSVSKVHFVGIGGIGMSGIAEILINQGFRVSGSDLAQSDNTDYLASIGAKIFIGHNASNVQDAEVCVYSSAVKPEENPETIEAYSRNIPVLRRAEMLAETSRLSYCLAISGTHGKTTTTSMCGLILMKAGYDPTVIVGGRLKGLGGTNARLGKGEWIVVEADEYDRSFLQLLPTIAIINNVEEEHLDIYDGFEDLLVTFAEFANKVPFYGLVAVGLDDPGVKEVIAKIKKKIVSFGLSKQCDIRAEDIKFSERSSECDIIIYGENKGKLKLNIPGLHNIKNALGAITVCHSLGIDFNISRDAIAEFTGVYRRFEIKGEINGITVVDDYAHHPTEIKATLQAARNGWQKRIVAVFQPHTYTRTQTFYKEFGSSFDDADIAIITDIYPAREAPIEGVTGKLIADAAIHFGHKGIHYIPNIDDVNSVLSNILEEGDMLITIGAGNIYKLSNNFLGR
ncbi:MAG: UDP-N-acetylmuramate--L-alanine ligase [Ignavibacteriae bacterium]|nr:UDP-N-acetylmuramate--L-alanine ligase [Ignavibacteriota bacterium]